MQCSFSPAQHLQHYNTLFDVHKNTWSGQGAAWPLLQNTISRRALMAEQASWYTHEHSWQTRLTSLGTRHTARQSRTRCAKSIRCAPSCVSLLCSPACSCAASKFTTWRRCRFCRKQTQLVWRAQGLKPLCRQCLRQAVPQAVSSALQALERQIGDRHCEVLASQLQCGSKGTCCASADDRQQGIAVVAAGCVSNASWPTLQQHCRRIALLQLQCLHSTCTVVLEQRSLQT